MKPFLIALALLLPLQQVEAWGYNSSNKIHQTSQSNKSYSKNETSNNQDSTTQQNVSGTSMKGDVQIQTNNSTENTTNTLNSSTNQNTSISGENNSNLNLNSQINSGDNTNVQFNTHNYIPNEEPNLNIDAQYYDNTWTGLYLNPASLAKDYEQAFKELQESNPGSNIYAIVKGISYDHLQSVKALPNQHLLVLTMDNGHSTRQKVVRVDEVEELGVRNHRKHSIHLHFPTSIPSP